LHSQTEGEVNESNQEFVLKESGTAYQVVADGDVDVSLLKVNLAKSPWERMQANDDALNFAESLRTAMEKRNAKLK
jgi:hypothetical protein